MAIYQLIVLKNESATDLPPTDKLFKVFGAKLPDETIHIIVQRPPAVEPRSNSPLSGDLSAIISEVEKDFFAPASPASDFLNKYVEEEKELPFTTDGIKGLPLVKRRGAGKEAEPRPSLLFLDLPKPPSNPGDAIDERFQSNAMLERLKELETQAISTIKKKQDR
ncbi:hypothetical protein BDF22DRAFT_738143 [Syncephalis plumigaleata]|nr:hypothetical protein BDF22DRAFT_738143 [Syncephalis plumigaleata]